MLRLLVISALPELISLATLPVESPSIFLHRSHEEERASADYLDWPRQFVLSMLNLVPRLDQKARRFIPGTRLEHAPNSNM